MEEDYTQLKCLNCKNDIDNTDEFCPHCGQKNAPLRLTVTELVSNFWVSLLNVDNTAFRTLKSFWKPWELTQYYMEGKRKSYLSPIRIFIVCLVLYLSLVSANMNLDRSGISNIEEVRELERSKMLVEFNETVAKMEDTLTIKPLEDSLRQIFFDDVKTPDNDYFFQDLGVNLGFTKAAQRVGDYKVTRIDALTMSPQAIFAKYKVENFWDKLFMKQYLRLNSDRVGFVKFIVKNLLWAILLALIFQAVFMKLLYIRRNRYFVEHLVFLLNLHSFLFLTTSFYFVYTLWNSPTGMATFLITVAVLIYFFIALNKYYQQGFFKTLIKYWLILSMHFFLLIFTPMVIAFLSLFIF